MIEVNSFAELRTTAPAKAGDLAILRRYYDKDSTFRGGGDFVGFLSATPPADDSGTLAAGSTFYWKRVIHDPDELNIYHFGGKGDGVTDDSGAFKLMMSWAQTFNTNAKDLGVRFPAGKFLINPIDYTGTDAAFFYIYGDDNPHGAMPQYHHRVQQIHRTGVQSAGTACGHQRHRVEWPGHGGYHHQ